MATASAAAWLLLVAAGCGVAVDAVGGPPLVDDRIRTDVYARGLMPRFSPPSKDDAQLPLETLKAIDKLWDLPFFQDDDDSLKSVTTDDIDKADGVMHPPLEYSVPGTFRQPDDAFFDSVADTQPWDSSTEADEAAEAADESEKTSDINTRRLADWLPEGVRKYMPKVPTLSSIFPSYIPGVNLQAQVHHKPVLLPAIPSPADLKVYVNNLLRRVLDNLHRKQLQLAELIKCSCPRPARCDGILEEFLNGMKPNKKPSAPSAANSATPAGTGTGAGANAGTASPQLSFYAGLTKPGGVEGPGLGFYVDQHGPHFSHHSPQHQPAAQSSAQSQASATSGSFSQSQVPAGSRPSRPSRPSGSAAQSQASATSAAQSQASATSAAQSQASATSAAQSQASATSAAQSQAQASRPSSSAASAQSSSSAQSSTHASRPSSSAASAQSSSSAQSSTHASRPSRPSAHASASSHSSASASGTNASATAHSSASASSAHRHEPPVPTPTEYTATYGDGDGAPTATQPTFAAPPTAGRDPVPPPPHPTSEYVPAPIAFGPPSAKSDDYPYSSSPEDPFTTTIADTEEQEPSEPLYPSQLDSETATSPLSST